jgi:DNA-binding GntR family transcriptional regulator
LAEKKKQLMNETVYQALRGIIVSRRFEPGQWVNVEELARELGVSRTPVWEATRRLTQEGILRTIPNRGVFMADRPWERVRDILEVRGSLDRLAGSLAVQRIRRPMLDKIARCLPEQLKALEASDIVAYYAADIRFHRLIAEAADNAYLKGLYESVTTHVFPTRFSIIAIIPTLYVVHQEIVGGLGDRDREKVDRAVLRHGEILMTHLKGQMAADAQTEAAVRHIKETSKRPEPRLKRRKAQR